MIRRTLLTAIGEWSLLAFASVPATAATSSTLASLALADGWISGAPSSSSLRGRVVVLDVFTFECIDCTRVLPSLRALYDGHSRRDLAVVGVHTPEVPSYQRRRAYLERETRAAAIPWPIAIDSGFRIWNAFGVSAWPTLLVFDRHGRLRSTIVGDGRDDELASAVSAALTARG